jgi:hypothetical protein
MMEIKQNNQEAMVAEDDDVDSFPDLSLSMS